MQNPLFFVYAKAGGFCFFANGSIVGTDQGLVYWVSELEQAVIFAALCP